MATTSDKEASCHGIRYYRTGHSAIRQLKRQHSPDTYGHRVWNSSWLLMDYLQRQGLPPGLEVLEIGCGWGLAGIFCAKNLRAYATCLDADQEVFPFLQAHADLNNVQVATLHRQFEDLGAEDLHGFDILIGADICFWEELQDSLWSLIQRAMQAGVQMVLIADPGRGPFEQLARQAAGLFQATAFSLHVCKPYDIVGRILKITTTRPLGFRHAGRQAVMASHATHQSRNCTPFRLGK